MFIKVVVLIGFFIVAAGMTNVAVGVGAAVLAVAVRHFTNFETGLLTAIIVTTFLYSNLPFGEGDEHGHAAPSTHWDPWGMAFRLVASVMVSTGAAIFTLAGTDASTKIFLMDRAVLLHNLVRILPLGAGCFALLTVFQIATNWSSAQPQG